MLLNITFSHRFRGARKGERLRSDNGPILAQNNLERGVIYMIPVFRPLMLGPIPSIVCPISDGLNGLKLFYLPV